MNRSGALPGLRFFDLGAQQALIRPELDRRMQAVLAHRQFVLGPEITELEQRLADYVGVRHCITVSSGTDALLVSLMALGIGPGDEVITTPFSFVAAVEMIQLLGARPVFVDIDPASYNLDVTAVEAQIGSRTRALLPADLFGQCADYRRLQVIASRHGLPIIQDAAQSFGALHHGCRAGSLGTIATTSFYPSKPLGCYGDGGACFTDEDSLAECLRALRNHGQSRPYVHSRVGINGRIDTLQAAVLLAKLEVFDQETQQREAIAARYHDRLSAVVSCPSVAEGNRSVWAQYTVEVEERDSLADRLKTAGIPTAVHYPVPLHRQPSYGQAVRLPHAEAAAKRVLSLPFHPYLSAEDQQRVVLGLKQALQESRKPARGRLPVVPLRREV